METHSSILAWRIPWTEEPGRLQSMGSQRVGHDWLTNTFQYSCLKNPMDRRTWWAIVHMVTKSQTWLGTAWIFLYYGVSAISWFFHGYIDCCRICPHYQQSALVTSLPRHVPSTVLGTEILLNLHGHSWLLKVPQGLFQGHRHAVHTSCLRK